MSEFDEALDKAAVLHKVVIDGDHLDKDNFKEGSFEEYWSHRNSLKVPFDSPDRSQQDRHIMTWFHAISAWNTSNRNLKQELQDLREKLSDSKLQIENLNHRLNLAEEAVQREIKHRDEAWTEIDTLKEKLSASEAIAPKEGEMVITRKKFNQLLERNVQLQKDKAELVAGLKSTKSGAGGLRIAELLEERSKLDAQIEQLQKDKAELVSLILDGCSFRTISRHDEPRRREIMLSEITYNELLAKHTPKKEGEL